MAILLTLKRRPHGQLISTGAVPKNAAGAANVNSAYIRSPDTIAIEVDAPTEAQVRGILQYAKSIDLGLDTSSIETAITAVIPA